MFWYINKGEDLKRDQRVKFRFYRAIGNDHRPHELIFNQELLYSDTDRAPAYPEASVKTLCKLRADLRQVDKSSFQQKVGVDGNTYFKVLFDLVVCTTAAHLKFSLEIEGKEMGVVDATYV